MTVDHIMHVYWSFLSVLFSRPHVCKFLIVGGAGRAISRRRYTGHYMDEPSRHAAVYHAFQDILHRIKLDCVYERIGGDVEKLQEP